MKTLKVYSMNCRFCGTDLSHVFIDLKSSPPSNAYLGRDQLSEEEKTYPLKVFVCSECFLVQLPEYKSNKEIFTGDYAYFSSYSSSWLKHAEDYTRMIIERLGLNAQSSVIEIASNDGYLLQYFKKNKIPCLGIEPTENTANVAIRKGIETIIDFFSSKLAHQLKSRGIQADLIIGNNVLAHDPNLNDMVKGLSIALKENGLITLEFPHLLQLIRNNQFDTIYHEHYSYFSLFSIIRIFKAQNLQIVDAEELTTHGGSLRIYVRHNKGFETSEKVKNILKKEEELKLHSMDGYLNFQEQADKIKHTFLSFIEDCKKQAKTIAAYGAAAKGNTLLNYCGIKNDAIAFVADASPAKQNKYLPGSKIPIVSEEKIKMHKPDYIIILPWNLKEEISKQLEYVRSWGGQFVIPIPELEII